MFNAEQIQDRLRQRPFRPLRIVASEGLSYDIEHPDLVLVGRYDLTIGYADAASPTVYTRQIRVAMLHIVALDDPPEADGRRTQSGSDAGG